MSYELELTKAKAQQEEMEKLAGLGNLVGRVGRAIGRMSPVERAAGRAAGRIIPEIGQAVSKAAPARAIGGIGGAAIGGTVGYAQAPEEGRLRGALLGAAIGGGAGLGAGQFATQAGRTQALRFGQQQLHGLTGYLPKAYRGRKLTGTERLEALKSMGIKVPESVDVIPGTLKPTEQAIQKAVKAETEKATTGLGRAWSQSRLKRFLTQRKLTSQAAQRQLAEHGATSIPGAIAGYIRGAKGTGGLTRRQLLRANVLAPGAAASLAFPAVMTAPAAVESAQTGDIRPVARSLIESVPYAALGGLPAVPGLLASEGVGQVTSRLLPTKEERQTR